MALQILIEIKLTYLTSPIAEFQAHLYSSFIRKGPLSPSVFLPKAVTSEIKYSRPIERVLMYIGAVCVKNGKNAESTLPEAWEPTITKRNRRLRQ